MTPTVEIRPASAPTPDVRALVSELEAELAANYPPEQRHGLSLDALFQPQIRFFLAYLAGEPVGCGGVALFDDYAELKRMYVRPSQRGTGVASALVAHLTAAARTAGIDRLRLETGTIQHAALRFYAREGFVRCAAFGAYGAMTPNQIAGSVFMERARTG